MGLDLSRLPIRVLVLCCLSPHRLAPWRTSRVVPGVHVVVETSTRLGSGPTNLYGCNKLVR
jgi:hypothetical protein